jgi:two-component system response regulator FixJ
MREFTHARPCCLICRLCMPELPGLELLETLRKRQVPPPVIMVTVHGDVKTAVQAMKLGAAEFLEIPVHDELLSRLVQNWIRMDRVRSDDANTCAAVRKRLSTLSAREREVLTGVLDGLSNKEMAAKLSVSAKSIEIYRSKLMTKMEASSISELVRDVLCCPIFQCSPSEFGYLCTGSGCLSNNSSRNATLETIPEIHFSRIEHAGSKEYVNASRDTPYPDR